MKAFTLLSLSLICLGIYLFVQAPPPLETAEQKQGKKDISSHVLFTAVNNINAEARAIYTSQIVGNGKKAGLKFGEEWNAQGVDEGPLPALFLREVSKELEKRPLQLGLYLGSDNPISPSNAFTKDTLTYFKEMVAQNAPVFRALEGYGNIAMFPDIASAQPCVTCHNEHDDSPKKDWKLGDTMGATTWTWPSEYVSKQELNDAVISTYKAIESAYGNYLDKSKTFRNPPEILNDWPGEGRYVLPNKQLFMQTLIDKSASNSLKLVINAYEEGL